MVLITFLYDENKSCIKQGEILIKHIVIYIHSEARQQLKTKSFLLGFISGAKDI